MTTSPSAWPFEAKLQNSRLTFSGTFNAGRIAAERRSKIMRLAGKILLGALALSGLAAFAASAVQGFAAKDAGFLTDHTTLNLIFWVGVLLACYLWAQIKQEQADGQIMNLLHWEDQDGRGVPAELDLYRYFDQDAKRVWQIAFAIAQTGTEAAKSVTAVDLLLAILKDHDGKNIFYRLDVNPKDVEKFLRNYQTLADGQHEKELASIPFTAFQEALKLHNKAIDPLMLLCALKIDLPENHIIQAVFFNLNVSLEDLETVCTWQFTLGLMRDEVNVFKRLSGYKPAPESNRGLTALPTPYLNRFSSDLTLEAKYGALPLALGRHHDLQAVFNLLSSGRKNICLKGEVGSGRSTLLNELAYKMVTEQVPKALADMRLVRLDISAILGNPEHAEQVLLRCLQETARSENIVLAIADIHALARSQSAKQGLSLLELLVDFLETHEMMALGTTTLEDSIDYLRGTPGFDRVFVSYELRQLTTQEILLACCMRASLLEHQNRCYFRYPAIKTAVALTDAFIKNTSQPQKAIAVLVEAASKAKIDTLKVVTSELIEAIVSEKTHIPSQSLNADESGKLLNLEDDLGKFIIGQRQAVVAVAEGLRRARSGLAADNRPLASFLFLGPTGVGKTEVAKTLAKVYFGEPKYLLRLDMSEYQGEEGLEKLIGSETAKTDSPMVRHLKNYPFCLLLLDEFEKAGPQVLNLFLQILEDGRLTSGKGELIDATHCLIIATSNAGSGEIQTGLKGGSNIDQIKAQLLDKILLNYYPPELLNRFDGVIIFSPLSEQEIAAIVHLQLQTLEQQLLGKGIKVRFTDRVAADIAQKAFEPALGARPIRRYLQDHIETFVAKLILQKSLERGSEITVDWQDGKLIIA